MDDEKVLEFFRVFDKDGNGRICRDEFQCACSKFIGVEDANELFSDLDHDGDGEISLKDVLCELRNYMLANSMNVDDSYLINRRDTSYRARSNSVIAWSHLVEGIGEPAVRKFMNSSYSGRKLEELYHELQTQTTSPELITHFEGALGSLLQDVKQVLDDNEKLKSMFDKEKKQHMDRLRGLEEELDAQVAKIEAEAREQARIKFEQEKKEMMQKMEAEMAEMQAHLKMFQKVNEILTQKKEETNNLKSECTLQDLELRSTLTDTRTNLALVHAEMAKVRAEYEAKCKELNNHQEVVMQYIDQNKHVQRQLALLHETNKNLQDTNDSLLSVIETSGGRIASYCQSRTNSETNSNTSEAGYSLSSTQTKLMNNITRRDFLNEQNEVGAQYVIRRLMEDIDSGHSTLRDPIECDSDHKSLHEEFYSQSDGESAIKSIESDDSKYSDPSLKHRLRYEAHDFHSNVTNFDSAGEPDRTYKIVFAGDAAVGKSCFIHRFCKGSFESRLGSTLGVDFQIKTIRIDEKNVALQLWDTAGQERFRSMTKTYFRRADGVVLLYDVTSERSFLSIKQWIQSINETTDKNIPILICGNKVDLREEMKNMGAKCVETKVGLSLAYDFNALFYETSSKTGKNIIDALVAVTREMLLKEDVEVQTSALSITKTPSKSFCCS